MMDHVAHLPNTSKNSTPLECKWVARDTKPTTLEYILAVGSEGEARAHIEYFT